MIQFKEITEDNFAGIIKMQRPSDEGFAASNVYSLAQAWLYRSFRPTGEIDNDGEIELRLSFVEE